MSGAVYVSIYIKQYALAKVAKNSRISLAYELIRSNPLWLGEFRCSWRKFARLSSLSRCSKHMQQQ